MRELIPIVLFGWAAVTLGLFSVLPARRAVLVALIGGWLFLPNSGYTLPGVPDYDKFAAVVMPALLCVMLFDPQRLMTLRFHWLDIPVAVYCLSPFFTSLANNLGAYDGVSAVSEQVIRWGIPYALGRAYFSDARGVRELAIALFVGGLIYVPLCLYEIRMSPQFHNMLYGFHPFSFVDTYRLGGYRPAVFLSNGLELGMWMTITAVIGVWLWRSGALRQLAGIPAGWLASGLLVVTVMCRSLTALFVLAGGLAATFLSKWLQMRMLLVVLMLTPAVYITMRAAGFWDPERIVVAVAEHISPERAGSLAERLEQEDVLSQRAWDRPLLGWGRWNRLRVADRDTEIDLATDGLWLILFGWQGLVGLVAFQAMICIPLLMLLRDYSPRRLFASQLAPATVLSLSLVLFNLDALFNAMLNPIYPLIAGSVIGFVWQLSAARVGARSALGARDWAAARNRGGRSQPAPGQS